MQVHYILKAGSQNVTVTCGGIRVMYEIRPVFKWIKFPNLGIFLTTVEVA